MSINYTPQYPVALETLTLTLSGATGTTFAFELTGTPSTSGLSKGLLLIPQPVGSSVPVSPPLAAAAGLLSASFTPDVAGEYTFTAYDMREFVGTPAFPGDPVGEKRYQLLATQTGKVKVGSLMDLPVETTDGNGATLQLRVVGNYVRGASFVDPLTEIGRTAALQSVVVQALSDVVGKTIESASTDFLLALKELREKYNGKSGAPIDIPAHQENVGHRARSTIHFVADTVNTLDMGIPFSIKFAVKLINDVRTKLIGHLEDSIKQATPAAQVTVATPPHLAGDYDQWTGFWHFTSALQSIAGEPVYTTTGSVRGIPGADSTTTPVIGEATDLPTATVLLCELRWRVFNRHIRLGHGSDSQHPWLSQTESSAPHVNISASPNDTFLAEADRDEISEIPMSPIDNIIVSYLDTMVRMDSNLDPPAAEGAGVINMAHKYGFVVKR